MTINMTIYAVRQDVQLRGVEKHVQQHLHCLCHPFHHYSAGYHALLVSRWPGSSSFLSSSLTAVLTRVHAYDFALNP